MRLIQSPVYRAFETLVPFSPLARELEHLFSEPSPAQSGSDSPPAWVLPLDLTETESSFEVRADLPGVDRSAIRVSIEEGALLIEGARKMPDAGAKSSQLSQERRFGVFARRLELPRDVRADQIKASVKDGVLTVVLPKSETSKPRQIEVRME